MQKLVLVHGRAQEHKDSVALKSEWLETLAAGLGKSGETLPIPEEHVRFPFYGDTLFDLVAGKPAEEAADVIVRGAGGRGAEAQFTESVLREILAQQGVDDAMVAELAGSEVIERGILNWEWVQFGLKAIDRFVPFGSSTSIALFTRDVYQYLTNEAVRREIEDGVRQALEPGVPTIVVSHSLGTVVSYNLLRREGKERHWNVPLYITLGSPIAVTAIKKALARLAPNRHPECVGAWFNAMDERDVVALYALDEDHFPIDPLIENKTDVYNHTRNRHGITGYLNDKVVAKRIFDALTAGP